MDNQSTTEKPIQSGLGSILERIGDFFHIFDLSYFVGGTLTLMAIVFAYYHLVYVRLLNHYPIPNEQWLTVLVIVVSCYGCGLVAFSFGRAFGNRFYRGRVLENKLIERLGYHKVKDCPSIETYVRQLNGTDTTSEAKGEIRWCLYGRMWSEVAHENAYPVVLHHLMRYWAMSATYDSVGFSLGVWSLSTFFVAAIGYSQDKWFVALGAIGAVLLLIAAHFAFRQASRYFQYQIDDLAAHFAVVHQRNCNHEELGDLR